jgi:uncharacterized protein (DUF779 family)
VPGIRATHAAADAVRQLAIEHGRVMFVQSAGCCDGSAPMCFPDGDFLIGAGDIRIGDLDGNPVYVDQRLLAAWPHHDLVLDVQPGYADGFSLAAGEGLHFISRYTPATTRRSTR